MTTEKHPNSHVVYLRRKPLFDTENRPELEEYFSSSEVSVGSYFQKGTAREASGLNLVEENILLPGVLALSSEDRDFRKELKEYYSNINTKVPGNSTPVTPTDGRALEIGLTLDNNLPLSKDNLPLALDDYIRYRQAIGHPWVGTEEDEGNQLKRFIIYDPKVINKAENTANEAGDKALMRYIQVKGDKYKVRMYLRLMGIDVSQIPAGQEASRLRTKAQQDPVNFNKVWDDPYGQHKYLIEEMVAFGLLKKIGTRVLYGDTEIGRDLEEAVLWLRDSHHSDSFRALKAMLDNAWAKNSISFDTLEEATHSPLMDDSEIEAHLKKQEAKTGAVVDAIKNAPKAGGNKGGKKPAEPEPARGLDIKTEPEPDYTPAAGSLGALDAEGEEDDDILEPEDNKPEVIPDDGRAKEPTPDTIK